MASVRVRFFAWLKDEIGFSEILFHDVETLADVLNRVYEALRGRQNVLFNEIRGLKSGILMVLNNKIVSSKRDLSEVSLADGDVIDFLPLGSGG